MGRTPKYLQFKKIVVKMELIPTDFKTLTTIKEELTEVMQGWKDCKNIKKGEFAISVGD